MTTHSIELAHSILLSLVKYDPENGSFTRLSRTSTTNIGDSAIQIKSSRKRDGIATTYATVRVAGSKYYAHRLAWFYMTGAWPNYVVDHIDGDPLNNKFQNLRDISNKENIQNQRNPHYGNNSGFLGVSRDGDKYRAAICVNGKRKFIGLFLEPELAHEAYLHEKRAHHATCTI